MKLLVALACLLAGCLANPHPCYTPPLLTGAITVSTQNEKLWVFAKYEYDGFGHRLRLSELVDYNNKSMLIDVLMLYREGVMYEFSPGSRTCKKFPLQAEFHPWHIPKDASLLGSAILGSSSGPGEGLLVNTWMGDLPSKTGKYISTVTEFGCIPVSVVYQTKEFGWMATNLFDNVKGITDPNLLEVPDFCANVEIYDAKPMGLHNLFHKKTE